MVTIHFRLLGQLCLAFLLSWRIRFEPRVVEIGGFILGGLVMVWVLLATLAMPWLDYTRSYERVGRSLAQNCPDQTTCVHAYQLSNAARGAMYYYAKVPFCLNNRRFHRYNVPIF